MDLGISGRRALVTGASFGIGRAVAAELAANGVDVAICARNRDKLEDTAAALNSNSGGRVVALPGDMSDPDAIKSVVAGARESLGGIDILVNNAGSSPAGRLQDLDDETWYAAFGLKLMGYMRCARETVPDMRAQKWGRVINIIGLGGVNPTAGYILGGTFNAGLLNFTRALAMDCAPDNVLVNGISPGATDTPRWQTLVSQKSAFSGQPAEEIQAESVASIPVGKIGTPEDIGAMAAFLCSERAGHVTGALINVDGGGAKGL